MKIFHDSEVDPVLRARAFCAVIVVGLLFWAAAVCIGLFLGGYFE